MKLQFTDSFEKDIRKYKDQSLLRRIDSVMDLIEQSNNLDNILNIKAMRGSPEFYRIRIGNFRLGFHFANGIVRILAFGKREDFYRSFP